MLFRSKNPLLNLELQSMHDIDTENTLNLHGLWSIFSRCAETIEDGKRLENLSWRIYSRETFLCSPDHQDPPTPSSPHSSFSRTNPSTDDRIPSLSSSLDSSDSYSSEPNSSFGSSRSRTRTRTRHKNHITPADLENIVKSVKEKSKLEPLSPLPPSLTLSTPPPPPPSAQSPAQAAIESPLSEPHRDCCHPLKSSPIRLAPESSTSTVATAVDSEFSEMSSRLMTADSTSTELSGPTPVHGFSRDQISCSSRSKCGPEPSPPPILKSSHVRTEVSTKKKPKATFTIGGGSSGEGEESSLESHYYPGKYSSLTAGLRSSSSRKTTSFKEEVLMRTIGDGKYDSEEAIDDSDDDDPSESAIDDDDDEDWEDDPEPQEELFQRVDSNANLVSRRSLLTTMMHEKDRAAALQNAASRSTPAIRRSRTTSPNGPLGTSPPQPHAMLSRARPVIMTTSNTLEPSFLSPRTTRRNMLSTELTGSLRKHLLWERQHKNPASSALLKRQSKSEVKLSQHMPSDKPAIPYFGSGVTQQQLERTNSLHNYFDSGLQEYHERGW